MIEFTIDPVLRVNSCVRLSFNINVESVMYMDCDLDTKEVEQHVSEH